MNEVSWDDPIDPSSSIWCCDPCLPFSALPPTTVPSGLSSIPDSIAPADPHPFFPILDITHAVDDFAREEVLQAKEIAQQKLQELAQLDRIKNQTLQEYTRKIDYADQWGTVADISKYIVWAGCATAAAAVGGAAATAFAISSGIGIANDLMCKTGMYHSLAGRITDIESTQDKIVNITHLGLSAVSFVSGLWASVGTIVQVGLPAVILGEPMLAQAGRVVSSAAAVFSSATQAVSSWFRASTVQLQADLESFKEKRFSISEEIKHSNEFAKNATEISVEIAKIAQDIIY